jgi:hypothetical protein
VPPAAGPRPNPTPLRDQQMAPGAGKRALQPATGPGRDEPAPRGDHPPSTTRARTGTPRGLCTDAREGPTPPPQVKPGLTVVCTSVAEATQVRILDPTGHRPLLDPVLQLGPHHDALLLVRVRPRTNEHRRHVRSIDRHVRHPGRHVQVVARSRSRSAPAHHRSTAPPRRR